MDIIYSDHFWSWSLVYTYTIISDMEINIQELYIYTYIYIVLMFSGFNFWTDFYFCCLIFSCCRLHLHFLWFLSSFHDFVGYINHVYLWTPIIIYNIPSSWHSDPKIDKTVRHAWTTRWTPSTTMVDWFRSSQRQNSECVCYENTFRYWTGPFMDDFP